ncbi:MAG: AAA family ATPase [Clostridiales bacterium]|nr:AAA family ATPase [Clostridiales bacterium]
MRLIRCHVENFGKLHDLTLEFQRDCHILCEPNGWGKSTLTAFLRVMFFGFEGETKRKGIENERKRYLPWQGGGYGGSVTFEAGGSVYTVTRIFSDKKQNDNFELRDARTNLPCEDFTERLGEELFHINSESFLRTAFLGQNDCVTHTTDSINAKIGDFTDNMNDMDSYDQASAALQEVLNKLNPRRKTGMIYQMNDQITRMKTEVSQNESLRATIRQCEERAAEEREKLREKKREQQEVFALQKQASRVQDRRVRQAAWRHLCEACDAAETACREAAAWFPGEIPTEEELRDMQAACDEMERAAQGERICRLSPEELRQLEELKNQRAETVRAGEKRGDCRGIAGQALLVPGAVVAAAGIACCAISMAAAAGPGILIAGIVLLVAGAALILAGVLRQKPADTEDEAQTRDSELLYEALQKKSRDHHSYQEEYEKKRAYLNERLSEMDLDPGRSVGELLAELRQHRLDWQRAKTAAEAARLKKQEFESQNETDGLLTEDAEQKLPDLESLNLRQRQLEAEEEQIRVRLEHYNSQLPSLREKFDEWTQTKQSLREAQERIAVLREKYKQVQKAQEYLTAARETLTARYMEPLMRSFTRYYQILAGASGTPTEKYRMDANANLTVEEAGMQRETQYLSRGCQDLIGLCLRLSLVDAMYPDEKPFLILDDPFVNLDPEKKAGGMRLLREVSESCQILYVTAGNELLL